MGAKPLTMASERDDTLCAVAEPTASAKYASRRVASDEEAATAFSYVLAKHIDAYRELAKYDSD